MKRLLYIVLLLIGCFLINEQPTQAQNDWTFTLTPSGGAVSGTPGSTVGWGYTIVNQSDQYWLFPFDVQASNPFINGTATTDPFNYPILAPNSTVTVNYTGNIGLADLTWNANAPVGFTNSGNFQLTAYYYDGDPSNGGQLIGTAGTQQASYQATVIAAVPESSTVVSLGVGLVFLVGLFLIARKRARGLAR